MGFPGVEHAEGHLGHEADVVVSLKFEAQVLQALCHDLWPCPAHDISFRQTHMWPQLPLPLSYLVSLESSPDLGSHSSAGGPFDWG